MIEIVKNGELTLAYILRHTYDEPGVQFFTPADYPQQLGYMHHPAGKVITPHKHNACERSSSLVQEVLFIRRGRLRVDFYDLDCAYLESRILQPGDVILLSSGGHGFEALEELEMVEVKQGPYKGEQEKTRFDPPLVREFKWGKD